MLCCVLCCVPRTITACCVPLQVGDRLLSCSAVFGEDMWLAGDLQRTRWAINNRPGKVRQLFTTVTTVSSIQHCCKFWLMNLHHM
jgi:hypothetical protein